MNFLCIIRYYIAKIFNFLRLSSSKIYSARFEPPKPHQKHADPNTDPDTREGPCQLVTILLPDMFTSFLSLPPTINPLYEEVKHESEQWFCELVSSQLLRPHQSQAVRRMISESPKTCEKITKLDFAWFCSIAAPEAEKEDLRVLCDWGNWVFPFDDMFDDGHLRSDTQTSQEYLDVLLSSVRNARRPESKNEFEKTALVKIFDSVWERVVQSSPDYVQRRFALAMEQYCQGILEHVNDYFHDNTPTLDEYMSIRRRGVGVAPVLALIEHAHSIRVPADIYESSYLDELRTIGTDVVLIQNDILSYAKEQAEGVPHNLITILRSSDNSISTQHAFNLASDMLHDRYRRWYSTQAYLPSFGEDIDVQVQRYILAIRNVMVASLNWHFRSDRYFKEKKDFVGKCRVIVLLERA